MTSCTRPAQDQARHNPRIEWRGEHQVPALAKELWANGSCWDRVSEKKKERERGSRRGRGGVERGGETEGKRKRDSRSTSIYMWPRPKINDQHTST